MKLQRMGLSPAGPATPMAAGEGSAGLDAPEAGGCPGRVLAVPVPNLQRDVAVISWNPEEESVGSAFQPCDTLADGPSSCFPPEK